MAFTYDPTTSVGRVRMIIPDKVQDDAFFTDEEIEALIGLEDGLRRAAALALETIASDSAMVLQVIRIQNISTDGASVARALLGRAASLRKQADEADANDGSSFEVIEFINDHFGYREKVIGDAIKRE